MVSSGTAIEGRPGVQSGEIVVRANYTDAGTFAVRLQLYPGYPSSAGEWEVVVFIETSNVHGEGHVSRNKAFHGTPAMPATSTVAFEPLIKHTCTHAIGRHLHLRCLVGHQLRLMPLLLVTVRWRSTPASRTGPTCSSDHSTPCSSLPARARHRCRRSHL